MRVDVKKFLFVGVEADRLSFFKKAQQLGVIEFIDPKGAAFVQQDPGVHRILESIRVLRGLPSIDQEEVRDYAKAEAIVDTVLALKEKHEKIHEELRLTQLEASRVAIFGNFSMADLHYVEQETGRKFQFFCAKRDSPEKVWDFPDVIPLGVEDGFDYFVRFGPGHKVFPGMTEIKIEFPVGTLVKKITADRVLLNQLDLQLKALGRYNAFLHKALVYRIDQVSLLATQEHAQNELEGNLFAIEGWVPLTQLKKLRSLCDSQNVHYEEIAIEEKDQIPTVIENRGTAKIGEDLVDIYDTPSITDKDPSQWVLWAFALFFGMIVSDAGYGLVLLLLSLYLRYRFADAKGFIKRFISLSIILSSACIVWSVLITSFFGIHVDIDNPIRKLSLINWLVEKKTEYHIAQRDDVYREWTTKYPELSKTTDAKSFLHKATSKEPEGKAISFPMYDKFVDNLLFEAALLVGGLHICISFLRNLNRHWSGIGWVIFLIGAYLYFPFMLKAVTFVNYMFYVTPEEANSLGFELMCGGFGLAIVLALIQKRVAGSFEFMTLVHIASDWLSYLRLYALGLAGMIMALTFNDIAGMVGIFFGFFVILLGHIINISLAVMLGTIHGLRLNFLEWYHYSIEGGGKMFKPLALLSKKD